MIIGIASMLALLGASVSWASALEGDGSDIKEFTVCELMSRLRSQRHKIIRVRGELYYGYHITALGSPECKTPFITKGFRWPPAIDLVYSGYYEAHPAEDPAPFETDPAVKARLASVIAEAKKVEPDRKPVLTITGFLRVREKYIFALSGYGVKGNGYGHLGLYPAQLVIKTIDDVRFEPRR